MKVSATTSSTSAGRSHRRAAYINTVRRYRRKSSSNASRSAVTAARRTLSEALRNESTPQVIRSPTPRYKELDDPGVVDLLASALQAARIAGPIPQGLKILAAGVEAGAGGGLRVDSAGDNGHSVAVTMLSVSIDQSDPTTLHDQVAAEIRRAIAAGEAAPGDRLPPAKDFAAVLGVNSNTVLRAFHQLRDEGVLEFRRGKGITVAGAPKRGLVLARARDLVSFARSQGVRPDELASLIEEIASSPRSRSAADEDRCLPRDQGVLGHQTGAC